MSDKQTMFVLMEIGFEYDDEYYSRHAYDDGTPKKIFQQKEAASKVAMDANIKMLREVDTLNDWIHDESLEDVLKVDESEFLETLKTLGIEWDGDLDGNPFQKASDEACQYWFNATGFNWFEVIEVELVP